MGKIFFSILLLGLIFFKNYETLVKNESQRVDLKSLNKLRNESQTQIRSPASVQESLRFQNQNLMFNLGCTQAHLKQESRSMEVDSEYVQLYGKNCLNHLADEEISVHNLSNFTEGFLFKTSETEYSTDLIYLKPGRNDLHFKSESNPDIIKLSVSRTK
ncbi:MAG TPA: hypothetical protein PLJ21_00780 [Pseudobdellovibrionaceae bacterium]|nr:hypothetical protein [Pseudobdellovibrionaceae bacterium]